ncbi:MAG: hypothetical protein J0H80_20625 [Rhizobiales bacterium]|nr:hypothetical protein [Hyphomicrobiales bacterium]
MDGTPVAGAFYERLISVSVTDKEGLASDTFQMDLNDGPPSFLAIPRKGAIVDIRVGYGRARSLGLFVVDKVKVNDDDSKVRENRLKLLNEIRAATRAVADFSRIQD